MTEEQRKAIEWAIGMASQHNIHKSPLRDLLAASPAAPKLTVWYGTMPESNGKTNYTAILHKGDVTRGITLDMSEYPDRVRYEADRMRWMIGELDKEPFILDYDADKHSGYAAPQPSLPAKAGGMTEAEIQESNAVLDQALSDFYATTAAVELDDERAQIPLAWQSTFDGLLAYVLQDDLHNRLTPRVIDIAYTAFMSGAAGKNKDDGGPCDWFNDTKPVVQAAIAKLSKDLTEARAAFQQSPKGDERAQVAADRTPPFSNCRFKECDLPGQCAGEGKCHHPAVAAAAPQAGAALTEEQRRVIKFSADFIDEKFGERMKASDILRELLSHPTGKAEDAQSLTDEQIEDVLSNYYVDFYSSGQVDARKEHLFRGIRALLNKHNCSGENHESYQ
jgi:hypothetical protein